MVEPEPTRKPPPWIQTSTGRRAPSRPGVKTLSVRQSSPGLRPEALIQLKNGSAYCGAAGPERVASRTPAHGATGCGGRKRSGPDGGAA